MRHVMRHAGRTRTRPPAHWGSAGEAGGRGEKSKHQSIRAFRAMEGSLRQVRSTHTGGGPRPLRFLPGETRAQLS